jgi:two-component system chemotaxis response regulator CheB
MIKMVCIGCSAGGISALQTLLSNLKRPLKAPLVIVQHITNSVGIDLKLVFGRFYKGPVYEVIDKMEPQKGEVYFAPPGYHLLLEKDQTFSLSQDEPVRFARPSIDVFMESAVYVYGSELCGVLLTGANNDGAEGMSMIHEAGGVTIVQDPQDAEASMMPQSAIDLLRPTFVLPLKDISDRIEKLMESNQYEKS